MRRFEKILVRDRLALRRLARDDPAPPAGAGDRHDGNRGKRQGGHIGIDQAGTRQGDSPCRPAR